MFDLKGSEVNRAVLKGLDKKTLKKNGPTKGKVLKDLDYIRLKGLHSFFNTE